MRKEDFDIISQSSAVGPLFHSDRVVVRYGTAVLFVLAIFALRIALTPIMGSQAPLLPFILAVLGAGIIGGFGPAITATFLVALLATLQFADWSFGPDAVAWGGHVTFFIAIGTSVAAILHRLQVAMRAQQHAVSVARAAETKAADSEAQLRLVADGVPVSICYVDAERRYRFTNRRSSEWFKKPTHQLEGLKVREVVGEERPLLADLRPDRRSLSRYVDRELAAYLRCRLLADGFAGLRCQACDDELLVVACLRHISTRRVPRGGWPTPRSTSSRTDRHNAPPATQRPSEIVLDTSLRPLVLPRAASMRRHSLQVRFVETCTTYCYVLARCSPETRPYAPCSRSSSCYLPALSLGCEFPSADGERTLGSTEQGVVTPAPTIRLPDVPGVADGIVNVTAPASGAIPNDNVDDTAAIRKAIQAALTVPGSDGHVHRDRILYFPAGTYNVNDTLYWAPDVVNWTSLLGVSMSGTSLTKTSATGWNGAGAVSQEQLPGDGFIEVTATTTPDAMLGSRHPRIRMAPGRESTMRSMKAVMENLHLYQGGASLQATGQFSPIPYVAGDKLRVSRTGSTITYLKNRDVIYTSTLATSASLVGVAQLYANAGTLSSAHMFGFAWHAYFRMIGENRDTTIIKLENNTFTSAPSYAAGNFHPNAVLYTAAVNGGNSGFDSVTGSSNAAFQNSIWNLTRSTSARTTPRRWASTITSPTRAR